jgi:glycosyltransferase involved in cell wall biosynthesis
MRILHVNKFLFRRGGAEGYMADLAGLQRAAGHEVAFFGMTHPENEPQQYATAFPAYVEFEPAPGSLPTRLRLAGRMLWSTSASRGIRSVIEDFRPDVVHVHNIYHQLSPSVLHPVQQAGIPAVMTLHDYKLACPTYQFLDKGEICTACVDGGPWQAVRRRCRNGSLTVSGMAALELSVHRLIGAYDPVRVFLCPSRFLAERMADAGVFPDRLLVQDNFADVEAISPQQRPGFGVVYAGRLTREKGVDVLVRAAGMLAREMSTSAPLLQVAGDGPERYRLEELATTEAPGAVVFHGRLPKERLHDVIRAGSVCVVPSRWHENQPLAVLEAFACGVAVVATALGGLPDLIADGRTGRLVTHEDPKALVEALRPLVTDAAEAHRWGRAARQVAEERFAPARHLAGVLSAYARAKTADEDRTSMAG